MMIDKISAIIISYNSDEEIKKSVNSIYSEVEEIIIIDNGSYLEESKSIISSLRCLDKVTVIYNEKNLGIAEALNIGFRYAKSKGYNWVLTLDDDSVPTKDMILNLKKAFEEIKENKKEDIAIIAARSIEKFEKKIIIENSFEEVNIEITSGNLVNVNAYNKVNGFDSKLFIDYVDYDFCFKLRQIGYRIIRVNNAILMHSLGKSERYNFFGKKITVTNHSAIRRYYMTRNRLYIWRKYKKINIQIINKDKIRFINETIKIIFFEKNKIEKIIMIIRGIRDYKKKRFGEFRMLNDGN